MGISRLVATGALLLPVVAAGCDKGESNATDPCTISDAGAPFGTLCTHNTECASCICHTFGGDDVTQCSLTCTSSDQCPAGSEGHKCSDEGYCKGP